MRLLLVKLPFMETDSLSAFSFKVQCHWFSKIQLMPVRESSMAVSTGFSIPSTSCLKDIMQSFSETLLKQFQQRQKLTSWERQAWIVAENFGWSEPNQAAWQIDILELNTNIAHSISAEALHIKIIKQFTHQGDPWKQLYEEPDSTGNAPSHRRWMLAPPPCKFHILQSWHDKHHNPVLRLHNVLVSKDSSTLPRSMLISKNSKPAGRELLAMLLQHLIEDADWFMLLSLGTFQKGVTDEAEGVCVHRKASWRDWTIQGNLRIRVIHI